MAKFFNRQVANAQDKLLRRLLCDAEYAELAVRHPANACIGDWLVERKEKSLLELGCGPGKYVALLSTLGFDVTGIDPFEFPTWELIRHKTAARLTSGIKAESLPFADNTFDSAVCLGALLYFDAPMHAMTELRRVLKPAARIVVRTVNKTNLYTLTTGKKLDPASKHLYTLQELEHLLRESGFRVCKSFSYGFWPPVCTTLWWYLSNVVIPMAFQDLMAKLVEPRHLVNNIVFAQSTKQ